MGFNLYRGNSEGISLFHMNVYLQSRTVIPVLYVKLVNERKFCVILLFEIRNDLLCVHVLCVRENDRGMNISIPNSGGGKSMRGGFPGSHQITNFVQRMP